MSFQTTSLLLILVYRPPATKITVFIEEFAEVLVEYASNFTNILCLGDFNFHASLKRIREHQDFSLLFLKPALNSTYMNQLMYPVKHWI